MGDACPGGEPNYFVTQDLVGLIQTYPSYIKLMTGTAPWFSKMSWS